MKIGIDARRILNPHKDQQIGVGNYTYQLIKHLLMIDSKNEYHLFFDHKAREKDIKSFNKKNVKIHYFPWSDYRKYLPGAYSELLGLAILSGKKMDILHTTSPDSRVPMAYRGKVVCTFQEVNHFKHPDHYPRIELLRGKYNRKTMARRADKIIAVSQNTKDDLLEILSVPDDKVTVINNGLQQKFLDLNKDRGQLRKKGYFCNEKFGIKKKYVLFIGTIEPSKNLTRLISAFQLFKKRSLSRGHKFDYQLVLAGKRGWLASQYLKICEDLGVLGDVVFTGYVDGYDLEKLLLGAEIFVMPSISEGFGMTLMEALAVGVPSAASEIRPLKELAGDAAIYFNPFSVDDISHAIEDLLEDGKKRSQLSRKSPHRVKGNSWEISAEKTLEIYNSLVR